MFYTIFEAVPFEGMEKLAGQYYKSLLPRLHEKFRGNGFREDAFSGSPHKRKGVNVAVWEDADAAWRWRNEENHLRLQKKGSETVYESYRLRIGPNTQQELDQTSLNPKQYMTLLYRTTGEATPPDDVTSLLDENVAAQLRGAMLDSAVYKGAQTLWITGWNSEAAATRFERCLEYLPDDRVVRIGVQRDYTKSDRHDAPHELPGKL